MRRTVPASVTAAVIALTLACADDEPLEETPFVQAAPATPAADGAAAAPNTDLLVAIVPDRLPLVGRRVALGGVRVQTVTGRRTFWVAPDAQRQLFVVLDSAAVVDSAGRALDVEPGQTLSVTGVVTPLPADLAAMATAWSLSDADVATLRGEQVYLAADSLRLAPR